MTNYYPIYLVDQECLDTTYSIRIFKRMPQSKGVLFLPVGDLLSQSLTRVDRWSRIQVKWWKVGKSGGKFQR